MSETPPRATLSSEGQALVAYLDRRDWRLEDALDEKALRALLADAPLVTVMEVGGVSRDEARALTPADLYRLWLEVSSPDRGPRYAAWFNLGVELSARGALDEAALAYQNAVAEKPDLHVAAVNLGLVLESQGKHAAALAVWEQALQPVEARTALLNHQGRLLETLDRFEEAETLLYKSLLLDPHQHDAYTHWLHLRLKMCAWPVFGPPLPGRSVGEMIQGAGGLSVLSLFDDNARINEWVESWLVRKMPQPCEQLAPPEGYAHDKIRIGYLSSDYCLHPISMLMVEVLERHDRSSFEIIGYCSSPEDGSGLRQRILAAFDRVERVRDLSDEALARRIRADEIDILVDLNGLTEGTRLGALRWRPAPVQVTYLGYVGSMPIPELDYAIADRYVVPEALAHDFYPQPLYMPRVYQANDTQAEIGPEETRADVGLPEDRFIYCCFSNTYKITEEIFEAWMSILRRVENSVLWVLARNPWAQASMRRHAEARGVDPARLIFAAPTGPAQYLSRLRLADLFLDTYPYNSGTTASDALRMGLPMVTLAGRTFSSRMAGSLLHQVGLGACVAETLDDYINIAARLGASPAAYRPVRESLAGDIWRRTLGDTAAFVHDLEEQFRRIRKAP
ncbi:glycosyl transferase family 1 [Pararhodospirillum photometricum]|nr:glycosyl transferase family 1 [Pararhodospirillum photometricum]